MFRKNWLDAGIYFDADKGDGNGDGSGGNGDGAGKKPEDKTPPDAKFTQADLDRIAGEARKSGRDVGVNELLKELGFEKADDLKTLIADARKRSEAEKTDLDKATEQITTLTRAKEKAEQERTEAIEKATQTLMRAAVLAEASKPEYRFKADALGDVWTFLDRSGIKPKENADGEFTGIAEALKAVAKAKAYLVEAGDGHGTPRPGARSKGGASDLSKEAQEQARRMTRRNF